MERVVKRSEIDLETEDTVLPSETTSILDVEFRDDFEYVDIADVNNKKAEEHEQGADEDELDFRLFANGPSSTHPNPVDSIAKIRLQTPELSDREPGFVQPNRSADYYFSSPLSGLRKAQLEMAAVTGENLVARSKTPRPGSAYSWKVLHIPVSKARGINLSPEVVTMQVRLQGTSSETTKRARPGKKARIKARIKLAAAKSREIERQKNAAEKELADREKRTRRNREKKVKKKAREKAKKSHPVDQADDIDIPG